MARLPQVTGKDFVRVLQKIGWSVHHQTGSHVILKHDGPKDNPVKISIPCHARKPLKKGLLARMLKYVDLTGDGLRDLL